MTPGTSGANLAVKCRNAEGCSQCHQDGKARQRIPTNERARIFLDGEFQGYTPMKLETLPIGKHILRVERPGILIRTYESYLLEHGFELDAYVHEGDHWILVARNMKRSLVSSRGSDLEKSPPRPPAATPRRRTRT